MLSEREFREASKHGCCNCTEQAENLEDHEIHWMSPNEFMCGDCYSYEVQYLGLSYGLN